MCCAYVALLKAWLQAGSKFKSGKAWCGITIYPAAGLDCSDSTECCGTDRVLYGNTCTPLSKGITCLPQPCEPISPGACSMADLACYCLYNFT